MHFSDSYWSSVLRLPLLSLLFQSRKKIKVCCIEPVFVVLAGAAAAATGQKLYAKVSDSVGAHRPS
jgi:hypothetical protein